MDVKLADIPPVMTIEDVCRLMRISKSQFFVLRDRGWFGTEGPALIEIRPPFDRRVRYQGAPFCEWLSAKRQLALTRSGLRAAQ